MHSLTEDEWRARLCRHATKSAVPKTFGKAVVPGRKGRVVQSNAAFFQLLKKLAVENFFNYHPVDFHRKDFIRIE
jgi:hypothetical protein